MHWECVRTSIQLEPSAHPSSHDLGSTELLIDYCISSKSKTLNGWKLVRLQVQVRLPHEEHAHIPRCTARRRATAVGLKGCTGSESRNKTWTRTCASPPRCRARRPRQSMTATRTTEGIWLHATCMCTRRGCPSQANSILRQRHVATLLCGLRSVARGGLSRQSSQ